MQLFYGLVLRPLWGMGRAGDRLRTALSIVGVGLGVGVVLAIQLANRAAIGSFEESLLEVSGRTNLSITGPNGVDEMLLPGILETLGPGVALSPVIEATAVAPGGEAVQVLGVDLLSDRPFRDASPEQVPLTQREFLLLLADPHSILVGEALASRYGLQSGSEFALLANNREQRFTVRGTLAPEGLGGALAGNLVVMDIAAAQPAFGRLGRLDRIDLIVPAAELSSYETLLAERLPSGVRTERPEVRVEQTDKMLRAFRWNLAALSWVSLVVGAFLIYNTVAVSVVRRRMEIGALRAVGATRGQVLLLFLGEALVLGVAGGLAGIAMGHLLARGALVMVAGTINMLYLATPGGAAEFTPGLAVEGILIGAVAAVVSALPPALEATAVAPSEALQRGAHEHHLRSARWRYAGAAAVALALAAATAFLPPVGGLPLFGYLSVLLVIAGFALLMPLLLALFTRALDPLLRRMLGIEGSLAARGLAASPVRISILTMALATAVAMMSSVAIMVGSFRQTVEVWAAQTLRADLFLRPAAQVTGSYTATLPPQAIELVRTTPGVEAVDVFRGMDAVYEGRRIVLGSGDWTTLAEYGNLLFTDGRSPDEVMAGDRSRAVVVSEPFATHFGAQRGQTIRLDTPSGNVAFEIAGVYYDYTNDRGTVVLDRPAYQRLFRDETATNLAIYVAAGADVDEVSGAISRRLSEQGYQVVLTPNARLQAAVLRAFDRTFAITYALEAVALLVAALGILNALLAWVLERQREMGILRVVGASAAQLKRMVLTDAGLVGLLGIATGGLMGLVLSAVLIFTINKQSFGWTIQFSLPLAFLAGAALAIFTVTLLAGIHPARVAARLRPTEALAIE